jgi:hypothetical protein
MLRSLVALEQATDLGFKRLHLPFSALGPLLLNCGLSLRHPSLSSWPLVTAVAAFFRCSSAAHCAHSRSCSARFLRDLFSELVG